MGTKAMYSVSDEIRKAIAGRKIKAKAKRQKPSNPFVVDTADHTDELFNKWKNTGNVNEDSGGLNRKNNGLIQYFQKKLKKNR